MTDDVHAVARLVLVLDDETDDTAGVWAAALGSRVDVRVVGPGDAGADVLAGWPPDRPWALLSVGPAVSADLARVTRTHPGPSRLFVAARDGVLPSPDVTPSCPVTVVLAEDADGDAQARATAWTPAGDHPDGGLVVRFVPAGAEPPGVLHPHLAQGVREDLGLP